MKFASQVMRRQLSNIKRVVQGKPLTTPSLGSMTLDDDDVTVAQAWLKKTKNRAWFSGETVALYEDAFAKWNGSKHAFAFMGGRVALSACIHALDLQAGDEVIIPGYTCVVVPNAFQYAGVKTVYCDIELETYGLDISVLRLAITPRTKAILIQHLFGLVCRDYEEILALAKQKGLKIIEDCAHSTGALYKGKKVGNAGNVAFYSSEQSKVFNTIQGGIAVTNDEEMAVRLRSYQQIAPWPTVDFVDKLLNNVPLNFERFKHPQRWWRAEWALRQYGEKRLISTTKEEEKGIRPVHYGTRMADPVAALGINQLQKIDRYNDLRKAAAQQWHQWCDQQNYQRPLVLPDSDPVWLRYPVLVEPEKKRNLRWAEKSLQVKPGVWFTSYTHPARCDLPNLPQAKIAVEGCVNLPTLGV